MEAASQEWMEYMAFNGKKFYTYKRKGGRERAVLYSAVIQHKITYLLFITILKCFIEA